MRTSLLFLAALAVCPAWTQPAPYVDPGMKKIVQVAIVCKDVAASSRRWGRMMGVDPAPIRTTLPGREVKLIFHGQPSPGQVKLTFFQTGDAVLELMQPVGGPTAWQEHLDRHGESVQHVAFKVVDLEKTIESLAAQGMPVTHRGRFDTDDGDYVYVDSQDKLGVTVELLHRDRK